MTITDPLQAAPPSRPGVRLLPDPEPRERFYPVISVDDHLCEPPHVFEGRMPERLADRAPAVVQLKDGSQPWAYEFSLLYEHGFGNVAGKDMASWRIDPPRYDEVRAGSWDIDERVRDMDIDGVYAQMCFPSSVFGFGGRVFPLSRDQELGLACMRAYNAWHLEELAGTHPGRIIPMQCVWLSDPEVAAQEIRANAARGFKAATFPDLPHYLGFPRLTERYWDPVFQALEETETVVCLHLGSGSWTLTPTGKSGGVTDFTSPALFPASSMVTAIEWVFSGVPTRFPRLRIALSEGGIGWVPMAVDRLDYIRSHTGALLRQSWTSDETPAEVLLNHFWYCMLDNPSNLDARKLIGTDRIMVESDYPHSDSTWPDTQALLAKRFQGMEREEIADMTHRTAERLFRHPVPESWMRTTVFGTQG
ncbi:hypothetical protein PZ61_0235550 [Streptomyces sp. MNU77]|uniref:amidohydrolase family protein n=1 Tax=Streptomyces sp. MNU77 TaxID=1573406 RepID=UPI00063FEDA9|nr:amidohydrolase family protein [Streptomyces sp. MNU77]OLO25758.1 hypothetical protein PZ61_0235550 [Streptomyces sp. MNU77]